jgi:hypothetical protein
VPRPTGVPNWGQSAGSSSIVLPSVDQRARGWSAGARLPAPLLNHWMALTYRNVNWQSYETVVDEDFTYTPLLENITGPSLFPHWFVFGPSNNGNGVFFPATGNPHSGNHMGVIAFQGGVGVGSGIAQIKKTVGSISNRDFYFESYVKVGLVPTGVTSYFQWGLFSQATGSSSMVMGFASTGPSYTVGFQWFPSGSVQPTSIPVMFPTAVSNSSSTGYYRFGFSREEGVFAVQFDSTYQVGVGPTGPVQVDNEAFGRIGAQTWTQGLGANQAIYIDKLKLAVKR